MSSAVIVDPAVTGDILVQQPVGPPPETPALPSDVARHVIRGTSALTLGVFLERGAGFAANILAARFAGTSVFGAYALGISTANNISTYAAGGIGATAVRFSGKYPYGSAGYPTLARVLAIVSAISAAVAVLALWLGAAPIAHLLHKESLTEMLRWASVSAAGIILLECARGFFVGQRRLKALVLLSVVVGAGMLILLPLMSATHHPTRMIVVQGAITMTAVAVCLSFATRLALHAPPNTSERLPLLPMLREVWAFGFIQLAGMIGSNLAGWWLTALVARGDSTLVQMGFFAIASQLRNLAGIAPGLLTEGSYAVMAAPDERTRTPHRIMALCTYASTFVVLALATLGILGAPWALKLVYGSTYASAAATASAALAVAVVHMGNAPAAARLTIVSIKAAGVINTLWACFVAAAATVLLLHGGSAAEAMAILFAGHVLSAALVLVVLKHKDFVPRGVIALFIVSTATILVFALLAYGRDLYPTHAMALSLSMLAPFVASCVALFYLGKRHRWLPSRPAFQKAMQSLLLALRRLLPHTERNLNGA